MLGPSWSVRLSAAPRSVGPAVSWTNRQPTTKRKRLVLIVGMMLSGGVTTLIFIPDGADAVRSFVKRSTHLRDHIRAA